MQKLSIVLLAAASISLNAIAATNYAASVVSYSAGEGFAATFTNANAVLGEPSRVAPYGETIDPFNPPYGTNQITSLGAGGSITIKFQKPIFNVPGKPLGYDFIIFGNSGLIVTNEFDLETYSYIGTPATDGSLFAQNTGVTRVSVSANGKKFYVLDAEQSPLIDAWFPTDSTGRFDLPVDPSVTPDAFAGATLDEIRLLYAGSAGGAAFNISHARDERGHRVRLPFVRYVKVEVLEGKAEIDAFSAVARRWPRHHAQD